MYFEGLFCVLNIINLLLNIIIFKGCDLMNVAIYLRKNRADEEAEHRGEFETLSRHKTTLLKLAREQNLNVIEIKEELVSGKV